MVKRQFNFGHTEMKKKRDHSFVRDGNVAQVKKGGNNCTEPQIQTKAERKDKKYALFAPLVLVAPIGFVQNVILFPISANCQQTRALTIAKQATEARVRDRHKIRLCRSIDNISHSPSRTAC